MQTTSTQSFDTKKDSYGISQTYYFLFQVDITIDGVGQADFYRLNNLFKDLKDESKQQQKVHRKNPKCGEGVEFKVTPGGNNWKFEVQILKNKIQLVRAKIYSKTAEKLTSLGVKHLQAGEPYAKLFLTTNINPKNAYDRKLFNYLDQSDSRVEVSFYNDCLKTPKTYKNIIDILFPKGQNNLVDYKCFSQVKISHYFEKLYKGESKFGRFIFIKHKDQTRLILTFIRFLNRYYKSLTKIIGFDIEGDKNYIFKIMLQSITDFTMSLSSCNLFYKKISGQILSKKYYKKVQKPFFINGDVYRNYNNKQVNKIFQKVSKTQFLNNLKACFIPEEYYAYMKCYSGKKDLERTIPSLLKQLQQDFELQKFKLQKPAINAQNLNSSNNISCLSIDLDDIETIVDILTYKRNNFMFTKGSHNIEMQNQMIKLKRQLFKKQSDNKVLEKLTLSQNLKILEQNQLIQENNFCKNLFQKPHHYPIGGHDIEFPFKARSYQRELMEAIINQLQEQDDIYISSQTGTGKTLSVQCSLFASTDKQVIYTSRTINQLQNVFNEFQLTSYSKEFINEQFNLKVKSIAMLTSQLILNDGEICNNSSCHNTKDCEQLYSILKYKSYSIIQLKQRLNQPNCNICLYHYVKYIVNKVDVLLCPYNFIFAPKVKQSIGLILKDKIIVYDEAHNVEAFIEEANSYELEESAFKTSQIAKKNDSFFKKYLNKLNKLKRGQILFGYNMIQVMLTAKFSMKLNKQDLCSEHIKNTFYFIKQLHKIYQSGKVLMNSYGIYRTQENKEYNTKAKFILQCLTPKVFFNSMRLEQPFKQIFMSGSLPQINILQQITGLKFQKSNVYKMNNFKYHCYLAIKSQISGGFKLLLDYKSRDNNKVNGIYYKLGQDLIQVIKVRLFNNCLLFQTIPKGVLILFPNKTLVQDCFDMWENKFPKPCLKEVEDPIIAKNNLQEYKSQCTFGKGCVLFCVHRGKYTEGYNFSGDFCNGIIMVGVPNLYNRSYKMQLKEVFYNMQKVDLTSNVNNTDNFSHYYQRQTSQTVIQGFGRGIRNEQDVCLIYLCDIRYHKQIQNCIDVKAQQLNIARLKTFFNNKGFKKSNIKKVVQPNNNTWTQIGSIQVEIKIKQKRNKQHQCKRFDRNGNCYECNYNKYRKTGKFQDKQCSKHKRKLRKNGSCSRCEYNKRRKHKRKQQKLLKQFDDYNIGKISLSNNFIKQQKSIPILKLSKQSKKIRKEKSYQVKQPIDESIYFSDEDEEISDDSFELLQKKLEQQQAKEDKMLERQASIQFEKDYNASRYCKLCNKFGHEESKRCEWWNRFKGTNNCL